VQIPKRSEIRSLCSKWELATKLKKGTLEFLLNAGIWICKHSFGCIPEDIMRMSERGNWRKVLHKDGKDSGGHLGCRQFWGADGGSSGCSWLFSLPPPSQIECREGKEMGHYSHPPPPKKKSFQIYQSFIIVGMPFQDITTVRI
jgi:hypothetical protein